MCLQPSNGLCQWMMATNDEDDYDELALFAKTLDKSPGELLACLSLWDCAMKLIENHEIY